MCNLVIHEVAVILKKDDITNSSVDAIVNINNKTLDQNFGVCKTVLSAAGNSVQEECKRLGALPHDDVVLTGGGDLKCKKLVHVINAVSPSSIESSVQKTLKQCDQNNLKSIAFPAFGTGIGHLDAKKSAESILDGIEKYLSISTTSTYIAVIYIIPFTQKVYEDYLQVFQRKNEIIQNTFCLNIGEKQVELIKGDIIDQDVDGIVNLTYSNLNRSSGVSGAILAAAGSSVKKECECIGTLSYNEIAVTSGGNLKSKKILHVIGPTSLDAFPASLEKMLEKSDECSLKTVALPAIGTGIAGIDPTKSIEGILEGIQIYTSKKNASGLKTISIIAYTEDIYEKYMQVFKDKNSTFQQIKPSTPGETKVTISNPSNWTKMKEVNFLEVPLKKDTPEYQTVANNFLNSAGKNAYEIIKITRIQNVKLWRSYMVKKIDVDEKNPGQINERNLYHGTCSNVTDSINKNGFNRSYGGKNATFYGQGTYFARDAAYSCDNKYSVPDKDGLKYVYQAKVITGRIANGSPNYKEPPANTESVVNNVNNPYIFVIFCDDGAYPEYLITFKS